LQRWYRTFPHGLPGIGLLVLRLAIGAELIIGACCMLDQQGLKLGAWLLSFLALGIGTAFVLGFLTRLVAGASVLAAAAVCLWHPPWMSFLNLPNLDTICVALAIALLGPGALSLDAYFFGPRKIVIPSGARS
jgi:uncharacterized membrane protein YphA (DoxX/SURF4 family)